MGEAKIGTEMESMAIILHAGNAKSDSYEALQAVKQGDFQTFEEKYQSAKSEIKLAHKAHAEMLRKLSAEELLVHAEGHLTSTAIAVDMIGEFGELYKWKETM